MSIGALQQNALAADGRSLNKLKFQAGQNSPEAIHETAKQLESLFMRELIKSMREATMKSGMLDNAGTDLGSDLLDQQLATQMTGLPGGLGDLIAKQLTRQMGGGESDALSADESALSSLSQFEGL
ncbi:MAG: flagellar assembly peptidoglycan hydrolase FlgJ, partial [Betaproteobacteria bacterium]|nr:flagellar assembly peptidoglycan hydrolase FlgJ [Betaproteobacteria bacterium]